ncbi:MAG: hypothetical protein WBY47_10850 [Desulfobacterales bacterium]
MKKRNLIIIMIASIFTLIFVLPSAWAGNPRHRQWEGVAIGVGTAVAGSVLLNNYLYSHPPTRVVYRYTSPHRQRYYYSGPRHRRHWEVRKRWVRHRPCRVWLPRRYHHFGR